MFIEIETHFIDLVCCVTFIRYWYLGHGCFYFLFFPRHLHKKIIDWTEMCFERNRAFTAHNVFSDKQNAVFVFIAGSLTTSLHTRSLWLAFVRSFIWKNVVRIALDSTRGLADSSIRSRNWYRTNTQIRDDVMFEANNRKKERKNNGANNCPGTSDVWNGSH